MFPHKIFGHDAGYDELHISESLRVTKRAIQGREKQIGSGNEDAFHVSLQILRPISGGERQAR